MPQPLDVLDQIRAIMERGNIDPAPANYDLCHRYVTSSDPEAWQAIQSAIQTDGLLSADALARIHDQLAQNSQRPGSANFLTRVEAELAEVRGYLAAATGETGRYGEALASGRSELALVGADDRAAALLAKLAAATDAMVAQTNALNARLETSSAQVNSMRGELDKARRDTLRDALTGLPNRRAFDIQIAEELGRAGAGKPLTLAFCDVDHFKKFNDTWGHRLGDSVLRLVGIRMIDAFHKVGFSARYGGEEFVAILPGADTAGAIDIANIFRRSISAHSLKMRDDGRGIGRVTISIGLAQWQPGDTVDSLVNRADAALYRAKHEGRDRVVADRPRPMALAS